jgi:hypothetical protein
MDETRWTNKVLECVPQEGRKRGRQRRGWRDNIKETMGEREGAEEDCHRRVETGGGETAKSVK